MSQEQAGDRLSRISTLWTVVCQAHAAPGPAVAEAQRQLWERYGRAVQRYFLGTLRDPHAADELAQEFAVRFLSGGLRRADAKKGRFRDYLKAVLRHMIANHRRGLQRHPPADPLPGGGAELADPAAEADDFDRAFLESWRQELLDRAWKALERHQRETGQPYHDVLHLRAEHQEMHSPEMAALLSARLGRPVTAGWVRQALHRARDRFADLLVEEVLPTLAAPTAEDLEQELTDLGLKDYCQPALDRYRQKP
jgi:RNA polymerase sigma-70 factor (ECF subfamily)